VYRGYVSDTEAEVMPLGKRETKKPACGHSKHSI